MNEENAATVNCPISVGYHLELHSATTFYWVHDFLLELHK